MTVLITGGAGYVGSHICLELLDSGRNVVVVDNLVTGRAELVPEAAHFEKLDVADADAMQSVFARYGVTAVIHCAGSTVVPESVADPLKYYESNTAASLSLLKTICRAGARHIIFSSTAAVYQAQDGFALDEQCAIGPASPYGSSKWMTETMIRDTASAHGLSYVILRYFNVAGADPALRAGQATPQATHLIKVAVEAALGMRRELGVFGTDWPTPDGTGIRDFIHVADLARAHRLALEHIENGGKSETLNCGYGRGSSVRQVVDAVRRVSGCAVATVDEPRRPGDLGSVVANPGRLRERLGWEPFHDDLDTIVRHALEWERHWQTLHASRHGEEV